MNKKSGEKFSEFEKLCLKNEELKNIYIESLEGDYYLELMGKNS